MNQSQLATRTLEIEKNRIHKQVSEGTVLLDEASALFEAKKGEFFNNHMGHIIWPKRIYSQ